MRTHRSPGCLPSPAARPVCSLPPHPCTSSLFHTLYDGDGQRISKTSASGTVLYVRDPQGQVIAEYSGTGQLLAEYVYVDGQRLCKITKDAQGVEHRVYYHADILGTPVALTNETGQLIAKAEYYPFGEEVVKGAAPDPHKFTGKELDDESGLYYFGARYYDAHLGRFVSVDPVGGKNTDPQSWNRYAYGRDNPLRYVDLNGEWPTEVKHVHQNAIDSALAFLPAVDREILKAAQVTADQDQEHQFKHAMRLPGQTVEEARQLSNAYVERAMNHAIELEKAGKHDAALVDLGLAIHALQDATSPTHKGFQVWDPAWKSSSAPVREHVFGEFYDPGVNSELSWTTYRAYAYFAAATGRQIESNPLSLLAADPRDKSLTTIGDSK